MNDRNKLIEKLGELSAKAYMFGRMYHIDEVTELTKDINELIAKVFGYSPWHTGTPTEEGHYLCKIEYVKGKYHYCVMYFNPNWEWYLQEWEKCEKNKGHIKWQKINEEGEG